MSLVSVAEAKSYMGITGASKDALIQSLINIVEGEVSAYLDRNLSLATYGDEVLSYDVSSFDARYNPELDTGSDYPKVFLENYPVVSLEEVTYEGDAIADIYWDYIPSTGAITLYSFYDDRKQKLKATYVAGYTSATLPAALRGVILDGVKYHYSLSGTASQTSGGVQSKKVGDFSVSYGDSNSTRLTSGNGYGKAYLVLNESTLNRYKKICI